MKLSYTRSIIDAIYSGELEKAPTQPDPVFNIGEPSLVPRVFGRTLWRDPSGSSLPQFRVPGPWDEPSGVLRVRRHLRWCTLTRA